MFELTPNPTNMNQPRLFTAAEVFELIQYALKQGYKGNISLLIDDGINATVDGMKRIIDDAVRMQNQHQANMQSVDFPDPGDTIPMTEEQTRRLNQYLGRLELPGLHWGDVLKLSYNEAVSRVRAFSEMYDIKGMTPEEIDRVDAYKSEKGIVGNQISYRGKTYDQVIAEIDATVKLAKGPSKFLQGLESGKIPRD